MPACEKATKPSTAERAAGDVLPDALTATVAERLALGADVAAAKFVGGRRIDDPDREKEILGWVARALPSDSAAQRASLAFFRDQIEANKVLQRGLYRYWRAKPGDLPERKRDLATEIRPELDRVNRHLMLLLPSVPRLSLEQLNAYEDLLDLELSACSFLWRLSRTRREVAVTALQSLGGAD